MSFIFNASELMQIAGDKMKQDDEEPMDSVMVFKDFLEEKKNSIAKFSKEEQTKLKALKNYRMHMIMDSNKKEMIFDLITDFKSVTELQNIFDAMNNASNFQGEDESKVNNPNNPFSVFAERGTTEMEYTFKNNTFTRTTKIIDEEAYKTMVDSIGEMAMMFGTSKYKLNYHFPRKIKSVSNKAAMLSVEGKTLTLEYGFMEYLADPKIFNLEVVLED